VRINAVFKRTITRAFRFWGIKVTFKVLHTLTKQIITRNSESDTLPPFCFLSEYTDAPWGKKIIYMQKRLFPVLWLADIQRQREFQNIFDQVRCTLVRTLRRFSCDLVQNHRDIELDDVYKKTWVNFLLFSFIICRWNCLNECDTG